MRASSDVTCPTCGAYPGQFCQDLAVEEPAGEPTYPCKKCGVPCSKAEGGTIFIICDTCWDTCSPRVARLAILAAPQVTPTMQTPEQCQEIVRSRGMCGELSPDRKQTCILSAGVHAHDWEGSRRNGARGTTQATADAIAIARDYVIGSRSVDARDHADAFATALVELARPNKVDTRRVDAGDYVRASHLMICGKVFSASTSCGMLYIDHPAVPGYEWLHRLCDGRLVKL